MRKFFTNRMIYCNSFFQTSCKKTLQIDSPRKSNDLNWYISKEMEIIKSNYQAYAGHKYAPIFTMIPLTHWIPDELHLMLRITDRLWSLMLEETQYQRNEKIREKIKDEMSRIRVHFEFWKSQGPDNWNYTSLTGEDKMKVLKNFNIESVLPKSRSNLIREL